MEKFAELKSLVESMAFDVMKFYEKGNAAASVRVRKSLQEVKRLAQELRKDISDKKKRG